MADPLDVLALEPWLGGSHARFLEQWRARSRHAVEVRGLAARHWKWRMRSAAWELARGLADAPPDALLVSDYVDLPSLYGFLPPAWGRVPALLYFHENQLTYPERPGAGGDGRDLHHGFTNVLSCVRAARVVFNGEFARDAFAQAARELLARLPSPRPTAELEAALAASAVVPPGIDLARLPLGPGAPAGAPLRVAFNHRWEHDKDPAAFLRAAAAALDRLGAAGPGAAGLELVLLGQRFDRLPDGVPALLERLADRVVVDGFAPDARAYAGLLGSADVVVSTARHEFCGLAVLEAAACGAQPLLPDRLSYPELVPPELRPRALYADDAELVERLVGLARDPAPARDPARRATWRERVARPHDAARTAESLDALCDEVAALARAANAPGGPP